MIANIVKAMWDDHYNVRQCSLIAGCSYDYALKIVRGERGTRVEASLDDMTDTQIGRKKVLDILLSLRGYQFVDKYNKYAYIALLAFIGYKDYQLAVLFPNDQMRFIRQAAHYSDKAWQNLDSTAIGMPQEEYDKLCTLETRLSRKEADVLNRDPHAEARRADKKAKLKEMRKTKRETFV